MFKIKKYQKLNLDYIKVRVAYYIFSGYLKFYELLKLLQILNHEKKNNIHTLS